MPLALAGLTSPLPPGWQAVKLLLPPAVEAAKSKQNWLLYYYNSASGESTWQHPSDAKFRRLVDNERRRLAELKTAQTPTANSSTHQRRRSLYGLESVVLRGCISSDAPDHDLLRVEPRPRRRRSCKPRTSSAERNSDVRRCSNDSAVHSVALDHQQNEQASGDRAHQRRSSVSTASTAMDSVDSGLSSEKLECKVHWVNSAPAEQQHRTQSPIQSVEEHRKPPTRRKCTQPKSLVGESPKVTEQQRQAPQSQLAQASSRILDWSRVVRPRSGSSTSGHRPELSSFAAGLPPSGCSAKRRIAFG